MANIFGVIIINKSGGLIYQYENRTTIYEFTHSYTYPIIFKFRERDDKYEIVFGETECIKVGFCLIKINSEPIFVKTDMKGQDVLTYLKDPNNYPMDLTFARLLPNVNEKIMIASMFHSMYVISIQLSPIKNSSGIKMLQSDTFRLYCEQTLTGIKFILITSPVHDSSMSDNFAFLHRIYADYALKNPFYTLEMPIRSESFDQKIMHLINRS